MGKKYQHLLAVDIGAGSGRIFSGKYDGNSIQIDEVSRFYHKPVKLGRDICWDFLYIWNAVCQGIKKASDGEGQIISIGMDSFAPDFGFFTPDGYLLSNMLSYRTVLGESGTEEILAKTGAWDLYQYSGLQCTDILTLPQLLYYKNTGRSWMLEKAKILPLVSGMNFLLTGERYMDFTTASISLLWDSKKDSFDKGLINTYLGDVDCLSPVAENQSVIGTIRSDLSLRKMKDTKVINSGIHDTTVAMYALECSAKGQICMNCGTWTAIGIVTEQPVINREAYMQGVTNYGIPDGRYMFGTVMLGLFYIQSCQDEWKRKGEELSFGQLTRLAEEARPYHVDIADPVFAGTEKSVPHRISQYFAERGQVGPETKGEYIRCILESMTDKYAEFIRMLEGTTNIKYTKICMGGGGINNSLLVELLRRKTGKEIELTISEVTVMGNMLSQLVSLGEIEQTDTEEVLKYSIPMKY